MGAQAEVVEAADCRCNNAMGMLVAANSSFLMTTYSARNMKAITTVVFLDLDIWI